MDGHYQWQEGSTSQRDKSKTGSRTKISRTNGGSSRVSGEFRSASRRSHRVVLGSHQQSPGRLIEFGNLGIEIQNLADGFQYELFSEIGRLGLRALSDGVFLQGLLGDFDGSGVLDVADIDLLTQQSASAGNNATFDLTDDGLVNAADVNEWIRSAEHFFSWVGDANLDGQFDTTDLVRVLSAGKYETGQAAVWSEGDFNGDGFFNTSDLIAALSDGGYEQGSRTAANFVPEPTPLWPLIFVTLLATPHLRLRPIR